MQTDIAIANFKYNPQKGMGTQEMLALLGEKYRHREGTVLASAARTATNVSADFTNLDSRGIMLFENITVASGTGGIAPEVHGKDPVSGTYVALNSGFTAKTATGLWVYLFYPDITNGGGLLSGMTQICNIPLPKTFRFRVTHGDASSYTYSLGYCLIP